ncbi:MAG: hypothetical protein LBQ88_04585 [Treponema sp.]|jgi:hypothetical protein|nr:hypothetical protein [Treponema sp.]
MGKRLGKKLFIGLSLALAAGSGALIFFTRPPLLVVTDDSFDVLYGRMRVWEELIRTSVRLWRPVKAVRIAENAGADMVAFAIEDAAGGEGAGVLIPYRYYAGALRYSAQNPQVPVGVLGGRGAVQAGAPPPEAPIFIGTDSLSDLYKAGGAAAILAGEGRILFFHGRDITERERGAFLQGLRDGSYNREPVFLPPGSEYNALGDVSCAVLGAPAASFLDKHTNIPLILFSWADPALTPSNVYIIFDDSPWALAPEAAKLIFSSRDRNAGALFPSRVLFPLGRIAGAETLRKLKEVTRRASAP